MRKVLKNLDLFKQIEIFKRGEDTQGLKVFLWEQKTKSWRRVINLDQEIK